ncbi:hypothetical protein AcV5_005868 [Taiwanofungus camphoratus]|nr:hypothetical protein AcV5_005868 [Antrodia cinnamomea]
MVQSVYTTAPTRYQRAGTFPSHRMNVLLVVHVVQTNWPCNGPSVKVLLPELDDLMCVSREQGEILSGLGLRLALYLGGPLVLSSDIGQVDEDSKSFFGTTQS